MIPEWCVSCQYDSPSHGLPDTTVLYNAFLCRICSPSVISSPVVLLSISLLKICL